MNNITFNENTVMLKSKEQSVHGNIYIFTKNINVNQIVPLTLEKVYLKTINGQSFNEFQQNLAYIDDHALKINSKLVFTETLSVGSLSSVAQWNDIRITDLTGQLHKNQMSANYTHSLEYLNNVGLSLIDELKSIFIFYLQPRMASN